MGCSLAVVAAACQGAVGVQALPPFMAGLVAAVAELQMVGQVPQVFSTTVPVYQFLQSLTTTTLTARQEETLQPAAANREATEPAVVAAEVLMAAQAGVEVTEWLVVAAGMEPSLPPERVATGVEAAAAQEPQDQAAAAAEAEQAL